MALFLVKPRRGHAVILKQTTNSINYGGSADGWCPKGKYIGSRIRSGIWGKHDAVTYASSSSSTVVPYYYGRYPLVLLPVLLLTTTGS